MYWAEAQGGGAWSAQGCVKAVFNSTHTVCTWSHLSSFAVLMALYPLEAGADFTTLGSNRERSRTFCVMMTLTLSLLLSRSLQDTFELVWITQVGLGLSIVCLFFCILTFWFCRSIQSTRTTIHLHLCVCLFIANILFLSFISSTQNKVCV